MKKISYALIGLLFFSLIWFLFIKPYDYLVSFKVNTVPGTINQTIKAWNSTLKNASIEKHHSLASITQNISFNDSTYIYKWDIISKTDTSSIVKVYIKDIDHSLMNRIKNPFSHTNFEKRTASTIKDLYQLLEEHLKNFKITIEGERELKTTYCAYIPLKGLQVDKAFGMMQNYSLLSQVLVEHEVQLNGSPFVEITKWDINKDNIEYNFCYPIVRSEKLPNHPTIKYKRFFGKKAISATYYGNYLTSDRAWYALLNHAERNGLKIENKPVEIFYNNPNMGGNELKWKAEVFLPLK